MKTDDKPLPHLTAVDSISKTVEFLLDGNKRFAKGEPQHPHQDARWRAQIVNRQLPLATVVSCADSRVPVELVFDQGIGDLFVLRSPGCVIDIAVLGGLEYAVHYLKCPIIIVLGHSRCGAVEAALFENLPTDNLETMIDVLRAPIRHLPELSADQIPLDAIYATIQSQQNRILARSKLLAQANASGQLQILAACYHLETGMIKLLC